MTEKRNFNFQADIDNLLEPLFGLDHLDAAVGVVEIIRKLIINDDTTSDDTKRKFLILYLKYKLHHSHLALQPSKF